MRRNHQYWFAHIHCFADGFETGSAGIGHATGHTLEKKFVVEGVEAQRFINLFHGGFAFSIPKELHRNVRAFLMPGSDLRRKTRIDHITMNVIAGRNGLTHRFGTEQRRNDIYTASIRLEPMAVIRVKSFSMARLTGLTLGKRKQRCRNKY